MDGGKKRTHDIAVFVFEVVFADVVFVFLRLIDDHEFFLHDLRELDFLAFFGHCQLGFFELGDRDFVVVILVFLAGFEASRCPDYSSLYCENWIPSCEIFLLPRVDVGGCVLLVIARSSSVTLLPAAVRVARPKVVSVLKSIVRV